MFVAWWGFAIAVSVTVALVFVYNHVRTARLEREIARLKAQVEREQEFSNQLISLMPEDKEEPK